MINVVIAARGRDSHINACLYYLDQAATISVKTILVYDGMEFIPESFPRLNLEIVYNPIPGLFNKSKLLNIGISKSMDADWISIVDADMIYNPSFFNTIKNALSDCIVCYGFKLSKESSSIIHSRPNYEQICKLPLESDRGSRGPSQISMRPSAINKLIKMFNRETLYHEEFCGWGYEDSDLSHRSTLLQKRGTISKRTVNNMWRHMWHEAADMSGYQNNHQLYLRLFKDNGAI